MNFVIDPASLTSVAVTTYYRPHQGKTDLTDAELLEVLSSKSTHSGLRHDDHPDFVELRNTLEEQGYIKTQRGWWNGDRVLKPFRVNGVKFLTGSQFSCACAIKFTIDYAIKLRNKRLNRESK